MSGRRRKSQKSLKHSVYVTYNFQVLRVTFTDLGREAPPNSLAMFLMHGSCCLKTLFKAALGPHFLPLQNPRNSSAIFPDIIYSFFIGALLCSTLTLDLLTEPNLGHLSGFGLSKVVLCNQELSLQSVVNEQRGSHFKCRQQKGVLFIGNHNVSFSGISFFFLKI